MEAKNNQHLWSQFETRKRLTQVVFLGASNLSRSLPCAVEVARHMLAHRLSIHVAMGFGRSYGRESGFLGKKISGIFSSRLWDALEGDSTPSTIAFVTDIGNDLAYEQTVDEVMEWVEGCVMRLVNRGAKVTLTDLPIAVLRRTNPAKFRVLRAVMFPRCRLGWTMLLDRAEELSERLRMLSENQKMPIFSVPNAWYGFDPIHPRALFMRDYWRELFALATSTSRDVPPRLRSLPNYWRLRLLISPSAGQKPLSGRFLPSCAMLDDGTSVRLY